MAKDTNTKGPTPGADRWKVLGFRPPSGDAVEPAEPILLEYDSGGQVAILTLNRPHAGNGITTDMGKRMVEILRELAARPAVRCIIITGAGNEAFSVGSDLRLRNNMTNEQWTQQHNLFDITQYFVRQLRKPIFAAVNGMTWAGAFELVMSCDFIIASENASFGQWESMVGLSAGAGGPVFLPRILPPGKALQMLMTGESITAQEAYRLGMVNEIYPQGELMPAARRIAQRIAMNSPTAVQAVKRATRMGMGLPIEQANLIMLEAHYRTATSPDRVEGIRAFNENRDPVFKDPDY